MRAIDCNIHVNSSDPVQALFAKGNVDLEVYVDAEGYTGEIHVNGGVRKSGPAYITPDPITGTDPLDDPFASKVSESIADTNFRNAGCTYTNFSSSGTVTLQPGVYCGGIQLTGVGTATFSGSGDGIYVIRDGELSIGGTIIVDSQGAAFYMTGADARVNFLGTADIQMTAPTTGNLKGFIFFGDHLNPTAIPHSMRGTELGGYYGGIYFPNAIVDFHGTANGTLPGGSDCTIVVADKFLFAGEPTFHSESTCTDLPDLLSGGSVALVN